MLALILVALALHAAHAASGDAALHQALALGRNVSLARAVFAQAHATPEAAPSATVHRVETASRFGRHSERTCTGRGAPEQDFATCPVTHAQLHAALVAAQNTSNGGFDLQMWGAVVDRTGITCAVAYTGAALGDQWPGSRIIAVQKANTANAFSLPGLSLSTANLYTAVQPGGSLYGLQHSNPVEPGLAYRGPSSNWGTAHDPTQGFRIGGINVFGGGVALYNSAGTLLGGLGVSGDSSCADHNIAWRTRNNLHLDFVPAGVSPDASRPDNIVYDQTSGWAHPICNQAVVAIAANLPVTEH
jgi:uncharacterized protein GlcG (DUF336 family)